MAECSLVPNIPESTNKEMRSSQDISQAILRGHLAPLAAQGVVDKLSSQIGKGYVCIRHRFLRIKF